MSDSLNLFQNTFGKLSCLGLQQNKTITKPELGRFQKRTHFIVPELVFGVAANQLGNEVQQWDAKRPRSFIIITLGSLSE